MATTTKYCPNCNKKVAMLPGKKHYYYGSPLRRCYNCFHEYIDKDYHEIAIEGIQPGDDKRITFGEVIMLIIAAGLFYFFVKYGLIDGSGSIGESLPVLFFAVLFGMRPISSIIHYKERLADIEKQTIESEKRLSNPEYALKLVDAGYSVPRKYLPLRTEPSKKSEPVLDHTDEKRKDDTDNFEYIQKYKQLLDNGIITQEEFEKKKKQLLDL